jgi:hypothetical protein
MGEYGSVPPNIMRRKSSSKLVKHEDLAIDEVRDGGMREISGYHDQDGEEYDSASSDEVGDLALNNGSHQSSSNHVGGGMGQQSYSNAINSASVNHLSVDNGQTRNGHGMLDAGHRRNSYNEATSIHHAFTGESGPRKMSFNNGSVAASGTMGMSMATLQGPQTLHQNGISGHPYQQQYPVLPPPQHQSFANMYSGSHASQPGQMGPPDHTSQNHLQAQDAQPHHAESSVRFIPGFLSATHGDTPTPSPPNGYRQGNGGQQRNGNQDSLQQSRSQHAAMSHSIPVSASNLSPFNPTSALARPHSKNGSNAPISDSHAQSQRASDIAQSIPNHPLSLAHATSHGLVSSGYNISLSAPNGVQDGSISKLGQLYDTSQNHVEPERLAGNGNIWSATDPRQASLAISHQTDQQGPSLSSGDDQSSGLMRRDYAERDARTSIGADAIRADDEPGIGGEDVGRDVGPGVGSSHSGGTTASLKALKMDLGEEGNDAANE